MLLRLPLPILLGLSPLPDLHFRRNADCLGAGEPEDRRTRSRPDFEAFITDDLGAHLIRPDRKDEKKHFGKLGRIRQWVESVFDTLKGQLTLEEHGGRSIPGVSSRIATRLLALAAAIWHNWLIGAHHKRSLTAYDHEDSLI